MHFKNTRGYHKLGRWNDQFRFNSICVSNVLANDFSALAVLPFYRSKIRFRDDQERFKRAG